MIRQVLTASVAAASIFAATASSASVVYRYEPITQTPTIRIDFAQIEFTDAAFSSGAVNYSYRPEQADPSAPVLRFEIDTSFLGPLIVTPPTGNRFNNLRTDLALTNSFITGTIIALGTDEDFRFVSNTGGLFTLAGYSNDGICGSSPNSQGVNGPAIPECAGATGRFIRVSEPGILPLLALGAFGVAASVRRRKGQ